MSTEFGVVLTLVAVLAPLAGFWLGVHLARRRPDGPDLRKRCVSLLREADGLRSVTLDFVAKATRQRPTPSEYRALVDAMLHDGTPETIRRIHHERCGTNTED